MTQSKSTKSGPEGASSPIDATGAVQSMFESALTQMQQFWAPLGQTFEQQRQYAQRQLDELGRVHEDAMSRSHASTEEMTALFKNSVEYSQKLGQQWMTMGIEASRRVLGTVAPSA